MISVTEVKWIIGGGSHVSLTDRLTDESYFPKLSYGSSHHSIPLHPSRLLPVPRSLPTCQPQGVSQSAAIQGPPFSPSKPRFVRPVTRESPTCPYQLCVCQSSYPLPPPLLLSSPSSPLLPLLSSPSSPPQRAFCCVCFVFLEREGC